MTEHEGSQQPDPYTAALAGELADCIRDCLRAIASTGSDERIYHAVRRFRRFFDGLHKAPEANLHLMFSTAIDQLRPPLPDMYEDRKAIERSYIVVALQGLKYLAELSADDPAANGRASRRESEFRASIKWIDEAVERSHRYYAAQRAADDAKDPDATLRRAKEAAANRKAQEAVLRSIAREVAPPRKPRKPKK